MGDEAWNVEWGWRYMFGSGNPACRPVLRSYVLRSGEPRWLAKEKREEEGSPSSPGSIGLLG